MRKDNQNEPPRAKVYGEESVHIRFTIPSGELKELQSKQSCKVQSLYDDFQAFYKTDAPMSFYHKGKKADPEAYLGMFEENGFVDFEIKPNIPQEATENE